MFFLSIYFFENVQNVNKMFAYEEKILFNGLLKVLCNINLLIYDPLVKKISRTIKNYIFMLVEQRFT